jgi:deoxycytidine triphosphate deaminase
MVLSDTEILAAMEEGAIIIEPFNRNQLGNCSYDVTLGEYFFRHTPSEADKSKVLVPWQASSVHDYWGEVQKAQHIAVVDEDGEGSEDDKYIIVHPGESILAHTQEFIGFKGFHKYLNASNDKRWIGGTTVMKARSSMARCCLTVCSDSGYGDIGYTNRWMMRITNNGTRLVYLKVGMRVAQIVFLATGPCSKSYEERGAYQKSNDITTIMESWKPSDLLPKMRI